MIERFFFNRPLDVTYKWDNIYDIDKYEIGDYIIWERLVTTLFLDFYSFFVNYGSLDFAFHIEKYGLYDRQKFLTFKSLNKGMIYEIINDIGDIYKIDGESTKILCDDRVKLLTRAMSRQLCYFCLVDMKTNSRLIPRWNEPFSYQIFIDTDLLKIENIFSNNVLRFVEKAVYLSETPEQRILINDFEYKMFDD